MTLRDRQSIEVINGLQAYWPQPAPAVDSWLTRQHPATLYISTITLAEMRYGIAILPEGRKKEILHRSLESRLVPFFADRMLDFDQSASLSYALLRVLARAKGRALTNADGYIAAIAHARKMIVATPDVRPFN